MVANLSVPVVTDQMLLRGCLSQIHDYQKMLYQKYAPQMFNICLRYGGNFHTAEDILQEGFLKVFTHLESFRNQGSFEGWVKRIFIFTALEYMRKQKKRNGFVDLKEHEGCSIHHNILDQLALKDLLKSINRLPLGYRTVFHLYVIEGYTHQEISSLLGISIGTSKSQLARGRKLLQTLLSDFH